jgi:hypothetical protein
MCERVAIASISITRDMGLTKLTTTIGMETSAKVRN